MYFFQTRMSLPVAQAIPEALEQLKHEGFGVLMDLDIQATMKQRTSNPQVHVVANEAEARLRRVCAALSAPASSKG